MSVTGYNRNEMATLHLVKTYCVPTVMCGCETWYLDYNDYHRLNVVWNNSFRRIYGCCWHESVSCLLFYCHTLPLLYMVDQNIILFWKKALNCDINIILTLAVINKWKLGLFLSKFLQLTLLLVTSKVVYGNTSSTWHTTVENYSSVRIRACTFSVLLLCFNL